MVTVEADEPLATAQLKAGFNAVTGLDFDDEGHTVTVIENVDYTDFTESFFLTYINQGYELMCWNSQTSADTPFAYAKERSLLPVIPVGGNMPSENLDFVNKYTPITCGSGLRIYGNATDYPCTFFDQTPAEEDGSPIIAMMQAGVSYNISKIQRRSSGLIAIKLDGITDIQTQIGFPASSGSDFYSIPVYFTGVTGTDILPLPDGVKMSTYTGGNFIFITHTTTDGTIDTGFQDSDFQDVTGGTVKFGYSDSTKAMLFTPAYYDGMGISISNVSGFDNNPNGNTEVFSSLATNPTVNPYGNLLLITHDLGNGTFDTGTDARTYFNSQSYSTPYIAGLLMGIKLLNNCDWDEAIGRAITTASEGGEFDSVNGYGYINYAQADAVEDTYLNTEIELAIVESDPGTINLSWTLEPFAKVYEIYFRGVLFDTVISQRTTKGYTLPGKYLKSKKNYFKVRAKSESKTGEFSNIVEYPYYYYPKILYKS